MRGNIIAGLTAGILAVIGCGSALALESSPADVELLRMKQELQDLKQTVRRLEKTLDAGTGGGPGGEERTLPVPAGKADLPLEADPLAALEANLEKSAAKAPARGNPRTLWNPQISATGDFAYNNSSLDENPSALDSAGDPTGDRNRDRFSLRELELAIQAAVDPFARADIFLALPGVLEEFDDTAGAAAEQRIEVEEAYLTYWRLPWGLNLKGGKFRTEFGKNNLTHTHALRAANRPLVIRNFLSAEGLREQGVGLLKSMNLGEDYSTQLELTGQVLNGEGGEESVFAGVGSDELMLLGRAHVYHDLSDSSNIGLGYSVVDGHHDPGATLGQTLQGLDLTYRWEPVDRSLYERFFFRTEFLWSDRDVDPAAFGGLTDLENDGFYAMAQYTFDRYWDVGGRYGESDTLLEILDEVATAGPGVLSNRVDGWAAWLTWHSTEFNRFQLQYDRIASSFPRNGKQEENVVTLRWSWALGPHGAHKY